ncbi:hypothetical protein BJY01DRAFT_245659 [Aspergillus pseudoustus]|uniref:Lipocalin-like domain-containing protein n=1 Tax=Aspergillus pseudoustus TaxID=1810923 RepID=A0ABR4KD29_9EURO
MTTLTLHCPSRFRQRSANPDPLPQFPLATAQSQQQQPTTAKPLLTGTWYITRSSSAFWRTKYGVSITFASDRSDTANNDDEDSAAVYNTQTVYQTAVQSSGGDNVKTVLGTDRRVLGSVSTAGSSGTGGVVMEWRGSRWLRFVSTRWEILRFRSGEGQQAEDEEQEEKEEEADEWMVVYAEKSIFTPAGISVYCRSRQLGDRADEEIRDALARMAAENGDNSSDELGFLVRELAVIGLWNTAPVRTWFVRDNKPASVRDMGIRVIFGIPHDRFLWYSHQNPRGEIRPIVAKRMRGHAESLDTQRVQRVESCRLSKKTVHQWQVVELCRKLLGGSLGLLDLSAQGGDVLGCMQRL